MFGLGNRKERLQRREERLTRRIDSAEDEDKKKRLEESLIKTKNIENVDS